jgi:uncharacterized hydrophobic protein (TIGR00271 family)
MTLLRSRFVRYIIRKLRLPNDEENIQTSISNIRDGATLTNANRWVLVCAILIASLGLNTNSTAVIIGAMLISPLMGPIMGFGLGLGINDIDLVRASARSFALMVLTSLTASTLFFLVSPMKEAGSELLGRTAPTLYDVMIAFIGGVAGIIAGASRLRKSNVVPGVAIATALMPPLCTMGFGLANFNWTYFFGAFYLFMINSVFIAIATYLIVSLLDYPNVNRLEAGGKKKIYWIITFIVVLVITPSIYLTYHIVRKYVHRKAAESFVMKEVEQRGNIVVNSQFDYRNSGSTLELILLGNIIDSSTQLHLQQTLKKEYGLPNCKLVLYQGPDSRIAAQKVFKDLSSDMATQNQLIKNLYQRLDSVQQLMHQSHYLDTLQVALAKEWKKEDSLMQQLSLNQQSFYDPASNKMDTSWTLEVIYPEKSALAKTEADWKEWLKQRLGKEAVLKIVRGK